MLKAAKSLTPNVSLPFKRNTSDTERGALVCDGWLTLEPQLVATTGARGWAQLFASRLLVWETEACDELWQELVLSPSGQVCSLAALAA